MIRQKLKKFSVEYAEEIIAHDCSAPMSLLYALETNGIIDNPYYSDNVLSLRKYADGVVRFISDVEVDSVILSCKNVYLKIGRIDTSATVTLNGSKILESHNVHKNYLLNVKDYLQNGVNKLVITIYKNDGSAENRYAKFKDGSAFSPVIYDRGVYSDIELIAFDADIIKDVSVKQVHSDEGVKLTVNMQTVTDNTNCHAIATLESPGGNVYFSAFCTGVATFNISSPNLWWPNGLGTPNLYKLTINLYNDTAIEDTREMSVGLRTFAKKCDDKGVRLLVNGKEYITFGGAYMPDELIVPKQNREKTYNALSSIAESGFNTVRVNGLGYYPCDYFYKLCDELGLVVWQDLMCFGTDAAELDIPELESELKCAFSHIKTHACLGLVLGAVDMERNATPDSEQDNHALAELYFDFYHNAVSKAVEGLGLDVPYHCVELDKLRDGYTYNNNLFDSSYSGAYISLPDIDSLGRIAPVDSLNPYSPKIEIHRTNRADNVSVVIASSKRYFYPYDIDTLSYASQLSAGEGLYSLICQSRRAMKNMAVIVPQVNDCWYSVSESVVDYFGKSKAAIYYLSRAFSPVLISATASGAKVTFNVSNGSLESFVGKMVYYVKDNGNRVITSGEVDVNVDSMQSVNVHEQDFSVAATGHETEYYLNYVLKDDINEKSSGILLFTSDITNIPTTFKSFELKKPTFECNIRGGEREFVLEYKSDVFVPSVEFSFGEIEAHLSDNYFHVTDNTPSRVVIRTKDITTPQRLMQELRIRSVYDIGR